MLLRLVGALPVACQSRSKRSAGGRPVGVQNLERHTHELVESGLNVSQVQTLDNPDPRLQQRVMDGVAVGSVSADRQIVDANGLNAPLREVLSSRKRDVDEIFDEFVRLPDARRVPRL